MTERNLSLIHTEAGLQQCLYSVPNTAAQKQKNHQQFNANHVYFNVCIKSKIFNNSNKNIM